MVETKDRTGEIKLNNAGQSMKILNYRNANHIDVQFEDGIIVKDRKYNDFKIGSIKYPDKQSKGIRIGETNINNKGFKMRIIEYRNSQDIDVKFEDGSVVNTNYYTFKKGVIRHPNQFSGRLNKIGMNNQNQKMQIINYKSATNIDVKFEDGTIVKNKTYANFIRGSMKNPNQ